MQGALGQSGGTPATWPRRTGHAAAGICKVGCRASRPPPAPSRLAVPTPGREAGSPKFPRAAVVGAGPAHPWRGHVPGGVEEAVGALHGLGTPAGCPPGARGLLSRSKHPLIIETQRAARYFPVLKQEFCISVPAPRLLSFRWAAPRGSQLHQRRSTGCLPALIRSPCPKDLISSLLLGLSLPRWSFWTSAGLAPACQLVMPLVQPVPGSCSPTPLAWMFVGQGRVFPSGTFSLHFLCGQNLQLDQGRCLLGEPHGLVLGVPAVFRRDLRYLLGESESRRGRRAVPVGLFQRAAAIQRQ